ncbi:MAG TPA: tetratricopeptide repeat protein [Gemmatimonadales bacterium]|nr:tetratricopeptide repeat protein [Gemmatimonadales bacterium]
MNANRLTPAVLLGVLLGGAPTPAAAQTPAHDHQLGTLDFPVSCSELAQQEFNRAVALLHHMTYPRAAEAFRQVGQTDSTCAMAHWGVAMTLFQPLWPTRPGPDDLRRGWEAVERARALGLPTERERLFVEAAAAFFEEPGSTDYWARLGRWEQGMGRLHAAFPDDPETAAFYALALLAVTPPDRVTRANGDSAARLLESVYRRNPDHPGAMHYLVHANDVPGRERELLEVVRRYETVAPRNPHALHMPTHIYTRLGDWDAVIRGNLHAAEAALGQRAGDRGQYVWDEFPHAVEYLVYAYLQQGADDSAAAQLARLRGTDSLQPTFKTAFHLASTAARYALERRAWREAMALAPREPAALAWDRFPWAEAVTWFARGLGAARAGEPDQAGRAATRLAELEGVADKAGEVLFARNIRILRLEVDAWRSHLAGNTDSGVTLLRQAVELEASTPKHAVTPGPTLPAAELLGDLLLEAGRAGEALAAYRQSLADYPRRFNSLLGASRAAQATGDTTAARAFHRQLLEVAPRSRRATSPGP